MRPVLEKPDPRPEVDRVAFEGARSRGRDRARRMDGGTGDIIVVSLYTEYPWLWTELNENRNIN